MLLLFVIFYAGFQANVFSQQPCDLPNVEITAELTTGIWAEEIVWSIFNDSDELIAGPFLDSKTTRHIPKRSASDLDAITRC